MQLSSKLKILSCMILLSAITGFMHGYRTIHAGSDKNREFASVFGINLNKYENFPCPSEEVYRRLKQDYRIIEILEHKKEFKKLGVKIDICTENTNLGKIARMVYFLDGLVLAIPDLEEDHVLQDFRNFKNFFSDTKSIKTDFSQSDSVARNASGAIELGAVFFEWPPLKAMMAFIHEARHSMKNDPMHSNCDAGDIPTSQGGCDERFSLSRKDAGAYAYGALFYLSLSLYSGRISKANKEYLLTEAVSMIGKRFNIVPRKFGLPFDYMSALDLENNFGIIHPLTINFEKIDYSDVIKEGFVAKLKHNPKNTGTLLFTNSKKLFQWSKVDEKIDKFFPDTIPKTENIEDMLRLRIPTPGGLGAYSYHTMLNDKNRIYYIDYDVVEFKNTWRDYYDYILETMTPNYVKEYDDYPQLKHFTTGFFSDAFVLTKSGKLLMIGKYHPTGTFIESPMLNKKDVLWDEVTAGVIHDNLFYVSREGDLYETIQNYDVEIPVELTARDPESSQYDDDEDQRIYYVDIKKVQSANGIKVKNFRESINYASIIDRNNNLLIGKHGSDNYFRVRARNGAEKFSSIAMNYHYQVKKILFSQKNNFDQFSKQCAVDQPIRDPWTNRGMGIDRSGRLVFEGFLANRCDYLQLKAGAKEDSFVDLKFEGTEPFKKAHYLTPKAPHRFSMIHLVLTKRDGTSIKLYPYDPKIVGVGE